MTEMSFDWCNQNPVDSCIVEHPVSASRGETFPVIIFDSFTCPVNIFYFFIRPVIISDLLTCSMPGNYY